MSIHVHRVSLRLLGLGCGLALVLAPSCSIDPNLEHCSILNGDATCAQLYPSGVLPYCNAGCDISPHGNGCVTERPEDECYSPCGEGFTAEQLADCPDAAGTSPPMPPGDTSDAGGTTTSAGSSTAEPDETGVDGTVGLDETAGADETTTSPGCTDDAACSEPTPLCVEGQCVSCSRAPDPGAACAGLDPGRPLCADDRCVACTEADASACVGDTPVCDVVQGTCVGCTRHAHCPDSACHLEEGSCLPGDRVWWVDGDAGGCAAADGSEAAPYCTIADALSNVGAGESGTLWVHARSGDAAYAGGVTVTGGRVLALRGVPGQPRPRLTGGGVGSPIAVTGGAVAYLERGRVEGSTSAEAVQVVGAVLHLDDWLVVLNGGGGVALSNGSTLRARNSVLGANGSALVDAQALRASASSFELLYVTVAGNDSAGVASLTCAGGSAGSVRNSIVVGLAPGSIDCPGLTVEHSVIDSVLPGDGVVLRGSFDPSWFTAPGAGDFHLESGHPFDDVALWIAGDPPVDFDGEPRPTVPGSPDVAGADR